MAIRHGTEKPAGERQKDCRRTEERIAHHPHAGKEIRSGGCGVRGGMGGDILDSGGVHQQHGADARLLHQCPELHRTVGAGKEIHRAMAVLDCGRRGVLLSLCGEGHPLQGRTLRTICSNRRSRLLQVEADDERTDCPGIATADRTTYN